MTSTTSAKTTVESTAEPTPTVTESKPKSKMTWAEKMAALPEDEAKAARAKAAEASRISKAKKKGTTPVAARTLKLNTALAKNIERTEQLVADRAKIEAALTILADQDEEASDAVTA